MLTTRSVVSSCLAAVVVLTTGAATGQNYPEKPIRINCTAVGGGGDFVSRIIAQGIAGPLGQPVTVDNRANAIISSEFVSKAPPDGYTLLVSGSSLWLRPLLSKMPWDAEKDFSPVTLVDSVPNIVAIHPSLPVKSVKELIALAKARPGQLNYGSTPSGSIDHLSAELFNSMANVKIVQVPYKAISFAVTALMSGDVQVTFGGLTAVAHHIKSGKVRALAVTTEKRSVQFPELPTVSSAGLPGYASQNIDIVMVPAKTPEAIVRRLNQEIVRVLNQADVKQKFLNVGAEVVASTPEQLVAEMKADVARMGKVIRDNGIKAE